MKTAPKVFLILSFILLICNLTFTLRLDQGFLKELRLEQHERLRALDALMEASDNIQAQLKVLSEQSVILNTRTETIVESHQTAQLLQEQENLRHEVQELRNSMTLLAKALQDNPEKDGIEAGVTSNETTKQNLQILQEMQKLSHEVQELKRSMSELAPPAQEDYLSAAGNPDCNPEQRETLYKAAIAQAKDKLPILTDYIDWQHSIIRSNSDLDSADAGFVKLVQFCDSCMQQGSVSDIQGTPDLKNKLIEIDRELTERAGARELEDLAALRSLQNEVQCLQTSVECEDVLKKAEKLRLPAEAEREKEDLLTEVHNRLACVTQPTETLVLPIVTENNAGTLQKWVAHFLERMNADTDILSDEQKLQDMKEVAPVVLSLEEKGINCQPIHLIAEDLTEREWQRQARSVLNDLEKQSKEARLLSVSEIISSCALLRENRTPQTRSLMAELTKELLQATKEKLDSTLPTLTSEQTNQELSKELHIQLISSTQAQYAQLLLQLKEQKKDFPTLDFGEMAQEVETTIHNLGKEIQCYKNDLMQEAIQQERDKNRIYREWAKQHIEAAESAYRDAKNEESVFSQPQRVKENFKKAWGELRGIHPGDLQSVDPELSLRYAKIKKDVDTAVNDILTEEDKQSDPHLQRLYDKPQTEQNKDKCK